MKTLLVLFVVLAGAIYYWKHGGEQKLDQFTTKTARGDVSKVARMRVETILTGMERDGGGNGTDIQTSICQWDRGALMIKDFSELSAALDRFNAWTGERGLYNRRIGAWRVLDSSCDELGDNCLVTARIEGGTYKMKVPRGARISWVP